MGRSITTKDLAKALQLNQSTVSRALSGHPAVKPATRERILLKAAEMNYEPDTSTSSLIHRRWNQNARKTDLNLVLLYNSRRELEGNRPPGFTSSMMYAARAHGFSLDIIDMVDIKKPDILYNKLKVVSAAGLMIAVDWPHPALSQLCARFPCVAYGYRTYMPEAPAIVPDIFQCGCLLVDTVIARGYRRILFPRADSGTEDSELSKVVLSVFDYAKRLCEREKLEMESFVYAREQPGPFFDLLKRFRPDVVLAMFWTPWNWFQQADPLLTKGVGYAELYPMIQNISGVVLEKSVEMATIEMLERYIYASHPGTKNSWLRYHIRGQWQEGNTLPRVGK